MTALKFKKYRQKHKGSLLTLEPTGELNEEGKPIVNVFVDKPDHHADNFTGNRHQRREQAKIHRTLVKKRSKLLTQAPLGGVLAVDKGDTSDDT